MDDLLKNLPKIKKLVERYFKSKIGDYYELDVPDLNTKYKYLKYINVNDLMLGEFKKPNGEHLGYVMIDKEVIEDHLYFAIKEDEFLQIQQIFDVPKYVLDDVITSSVSEILGKKIKYTIQV